MSVKYLALTTDCNAVHCKINPRQGAKMAVAEACRNIVCSGGRPLAGSDNLNFGNPYKPENFWQLRECVEGMAEACRFFGTPITGGNVSLYNESPEGAIDPTPVFCAVGLIEEEKWITTQWFKQAGDRIFLLGSVGAGLGGSQYLIQRTGKKLGPLPSFDEMAEKRLQDAVSAAIRAGIVRSAHDCSEGGLAVALAEGCISGSALRGATIGLTASGDRADDLLFNEAPTRVILSVPPDQDETLRGLCRQAGVHCVEIGVVGGGDFTLRVGDRLLIQRPVTELRHAWYDSLGATLGA